MRYALPVLVAVAVTGCKNDVTLAETLHVEPVVQILIELGATDADGALAEASIRLIVREAAKIQVVDISSPTEFDTFALGATVGFLGVVYDPKQASETLVGNSGQGS